MRRYSVKRPLGMPLRFAWLYTYKFWNLYIDDEGEGNE